MSKADHQARAIIHRKILDTAAEKPDATLDGIAKDVSGATPEFVERVLDEYGDPGQEAPPEEDEEDTVDETSPSLDDLTSMQREIVAAIHESPSASQRDLAKRFDVATSTINRQVNSITGFDWSDREQFVTEHFDLSNQTVTTAPKAKNNGSQPSESTDLSDRVRRLEDRLDAAEPAEAAISDRFEDPELVHKIVRACLRDDDITEDDELRIIADLMQ